MVNIAETLKHIDRMFHEPARLAITMELLDGPRTFNDLKTALELTDGNLAVHARKLEDEQYIEIEKRFVGRIPQTAYRLTQSGRDAAAAYSVRLDVVSKHLSNALQN